MATIRRTRRWCNSRSGVGLPAAEVATELGTSENAILLAKSRTPNRLRAESAGLAERVTSLASVAGNEVLQTLLESSPFVGTRPKCIARFMPRPVGQPSKDTPRSFLRDPAIVRNSYSACAPRIFMAPSFRWRLSRSIGGASSIAIEFALLQLEYILKNFYFITGCNAANCQDIPIDIAENELNSDGCSPRYILSVAHLFS